MLLELLRALQTIAPQPPPPQAPQGAPPSRSVPTDPPPTPIEPSPVAPSNPNVPVTPPGYVPPSTPPNFGPLPQPPQGTPQPNVVPVGGNPPAPQATPPTTPQPDPDPSPAPPQGDPQQQPPPPQDFVPVVTLPDGTHVPISQYRVTLDNGNEVPFTDMVRSQNDIDRQAQELRSQAERVQQWEQSLQQNPYGHQQQQQQQLPASQAGQYPTYTAPQYPHQQQSHAVIDPNTLGEYATDGERTLANSLNQYAMGQDQQIQQMAQQINQSNNLLEQQFMMGDLRRASDSYGVPQDDLVREWERTQVNNFDTLGEIIQLRRQMEQQQAQNTIQQAQQVSQAVSVGPGQVNPYQQTTPNTIQGRGVVDYRNAADVLAAYDLDPTQMVSQ